MVIVTPSGRTAPINSSSLFGMTARGADGARRCRDRRQDAGERPISTAMQQGQLSRHPPQPRHRRRQRSAMSAAQRFSAAVDRMKARCAGTCSCSPTSPIVTGIKDLVAASPVPVVFDHFGGAEAALGTAASGVLPTSSRSVHVRRGLRQDLQRLPRPPSWRRTLADAAAARAGTDRGQCRAASSRAPTGCTRIR